MAAVEEATKLTYSEVLDIIYEQLGQDAFYKATITAGQPFLSICNQAGIDVTVSPSGNILGYSKHVVGSKPLSSSEEIAQALNSNLQSGTAAVENTGAFDEIVNTTVEAGKVKPVSTVTKFTNGVKGVLNTPVAGKITPAIMAAAAGIQLGKTIDSAIYNIGKAMGANPPEELNPETWNNITADMSDKGLEGIDKWAFNTIFGLNPKTGEATMYADENAFAYMAMWLQNNDFFINEETVNYDELKNNKALFYPERLKEVYSSNGYASTGNLNGTHTIATGALFINIKNIIYGISKTAGTFVTTRSWDETPVIRHMTIQAGPNKETEKKYPVYMDYIDYQSGSPYVPKESNGHILDVARVALYGQISKPLNGVTNQPNATIPDLSTVTTPEETLNLLKQTYPELWNNAVQQDVMQPDGSVKTYTYVPLPMPTEGDGNQVGTTGAVQNQPTITPDNSTESQLATLIKILTNSQNQPQGQTKELPKDYPINPTKNPNPPDVGGGETPVVVVPTGSANALYSIYNPSQSQLNSFGAWLWSSNFVDQLLKLFNDPMQAIIGLHKVFATPPISGAGTIKVGYLDSGVSSNIVGNQYTTVDCGSVNLYEYYGNVFDYDPFTKVNLYLPFIGIVPLNVGEIMRSTIHIIYHVDVLTGACLAEVKINRDSAGGTLFQYSGNAAVQYPISSGSYMSIISGIMSIAGGVAGTIATGGAAMPVLLGAGASVGRMHTDISHSGSFSGNAGAMGIKKPYLIIDRPQTALAKNFSNYVGYPSNSTVTLLGCKGFTKVKEVHLENIPATNDELTDIETKLKVGVII